MHSVILAPVLAGCDGGRARVSVDTMSGVEGVHTLPRMDLVSRGRTATSVQTWSFRAGRLS
jgi:hypothetical protein